jgi:Holliday junction resolvasome RuvABC endonuclease subunit
VSQHVWGVDVGEAKVAIAMVADDGTATSRVVEIADKRDPRRFALLERHLRTFYVECAQRSDPLAVFVEQPTGRFPNPWLTGAWAIACAAASELDGRYPYMVPLFTVGVTAWKRLTVGRGNAKKGEVTAWVRAEGFAGATQDECDAYAIARAGQAMIAQGAQAAA